MEFEKTAERVFQHMIQKKRKRPPLSEIHSEFSKGELGLLTYLAFEKDGAVAGELGKELAVSSARVASILNALETKEMVTRVVDDQDKRKTIVYISKAGKAKMEEKRQQAIQQIASIFEKLGEHDTTELIRIIEKIYSLLDEERQCPFK